MDIIKILQEELGIRRGQVETTIKLIDEGNTIPFIARYRKEMTGSLDDETLRNFHERLLYLRNLEDRKEAIKKNIEEQGKLTKELAKQIEEAKTLVAVEDLYRPYKQKKRTRAMIAKEKGLEPLANLILLQMTNEPLEKEAKAFINEEKDVKTVEDALKGANDIIAEHIADDAEYRTWIRKATWDHGKITSTAKKPDESSVFEMYYDFEEPIKKIAGYRILAINRGEKEGILQVKIEPDMQKIASYLARKIVTKKNPNTITIRAPIGLTGNAGTSQMAIPITRIITSKNGIGMSCSVRSAEALLFFFILCIACLKVFAMSGRLLIRLITPPVATAPAPIYLM